VRIYRENNFLHGTIKECGNELDEYVDVASYFIEPHNNYIEYGPIEKDRLTCEVSISDAHKIAPLFVKEYAQHLDLECIRDKLRNNP